jgi:uncharacterized membrane protein
LSGKKNRYLSEAAVIAALYAALTYVSGAFGAAYLGVQFRISEALTIMPIFSTASIWGLVIGCVFGNIGSPFFVMDMVFGSLATLLAAILTRKLRQKKIKGFPVFSFLPPIILNAFFVGAEIAFLADGAFSVKLFIISALQVAAGEAAVLLLLGVPLYKAVKMLKLYSN